MDFDEDLRAIKHTLQQVYRLSIRVIESLDNSTLLRAAQTMFKGREAATTNLLRPDAGNQTTRISQHLICTQAPRHSAEDHEFVIRRALERHLLLYMGRCARTCEHTNIRLAHFRAASKLTKYGVYQSTTQDLAAVESCRIRDTKV